VTARRTACAIIAFVVAMPLGAGAQRADSTCSTLPVQRSDSASAGARSLAAIDTVITLNVGDRRWQRDSVSVGVAFGASGTAGARGAPWRACVGVSALLGHVTANLHNVRGRIHLKVDPAALDSIGRTATSPAVPPRR
jgi:hypothetical protein